MQPARSQAFVKTTAGKGSIAFFFFGAYAALFFLGDSDSNRDVSPESTGVFGIEAAPSAGGASISIPAAVVVVVFVDTCGALALDFFLAALTVVALLRICPRGPILLCTGVGESSGRMRGGGDSALTGIASAKGGGTIPGRRGTDGGGAVVASVLKRC